jgi:hypothetical protein
MGARPYETVQCAPPRGARKCARHSRPPLRQSSQVSLHRVKPAGTSTRAKSRGEAPLSNERNVNMPIPLRLARIGRPSERAPKRPPSSAGRCRTHARHASDLRRHRAHRLAHPRARVGPSSRAHPKAAHLLHPCGVREHFARGDRLVLAPAPSCLGNGLEPHRTGRQYEQTLAWLGGRLGRQKIGRRMPDDDPLLRASLVGAGSLPHLSMSGPSVPTKGEARRPPRPRESAARRRPRARAVSFQAGYCLRSARTAVSVVAPSRAKQSSSSLPIS